MYNWTDKTKVDRQLIITVYKSHKSEKIVEIKLDIVSLSSLTSSYREVQ